MYIVQTPGRSIQTGACDILMRFKMLLEAVHTLAILLVRLIVTGNPLCAPIGSLQQTHFEPGGCDFSTLAVFVPKFDAPIGFIPTVEFFARIGHVGHGRRFHFSAVPDRFSAPLADNLIGGLLFSALTIPVKPGRLYTKTEGLGQIFCS